jgi:hypothetical protein
VSAIVSIQTPRNGQNKDRYLRAVVEEETPDAIRRTVTQMMRKPSEYDLSRHRYTDRFGTKRGKRPAPVRRVDDESAEPRELQAT